MYRLLHDSFDAILQSWNLIYSYELPQSTTVTDLITRIIGDMESCPYSYQFTTIPSTSSLLVHEVHPLQPLEISNRGIPRNDNQVRLRRGNHAHQTLWNLTQNRYFAVPALSVEGNRFVIHFGESALDVHNFFNLSFGLMNSCSQLPLDCDYMP